LKKHRKKFLHNFAISVSFYRSTFLSCEKENLLANKKAPRKQKNSQQTKKALSKHKHSQQIKNLQANKKFISKQKSFHKVKRQETLYSIWNFKISGSS